MATAFEQPVIVGIGEILWDVFPDGPRFGGAPANFACSTAGLADDVYDVVMVSGVGRDESGRSAIRELKSHGVLTQCVQQSEFQTGRVDVRIDASGDASYEFAENTAWDNLQWTNDLAATARTAAAVCFGSLGQRSDISRQVIEQFVMATPAHALRVFDVNLRPPFWTSEVITASLPLANVLKCNDDELPMIAELVGFKGESAELLQQFGERFDYRVIALTCGANGSLLWTPEGIDRVAGVEVQVADTVGAGDSFTAALILGLLKDEPLAQVHQRAAQVAAFVCSQPGATPRIPPM
ncbi:MAG TPA: carbohydrate kinase [Planctomycetaceae bacterium]|nr:carbohydrate kinase [Planctomycetaceae bacterium]